ncbi:MAG: outer membrane protein transport protein [Nitrospiraceae bacterium]|nr:outer membrane protein transport protein [Nitrospiraceae bacterium]
MKKSLSAIMLVALVGCLSMSLPATVYATDGMNLEGYGPIATGMGGASMAYDNGTAAMMNNPATLGLMPDGNRLDVALGYLGPNITVTGPQETTSQSNAFYMPAIGWIQKSGQSAYGVGVFAQGGMGAQYAADTFLAAGSGEKVRSELSVGRLIVPYAYEVNKNLSVAASVDYVWAGLDLKMALPGSAFLDMAGGSQKYGTVSGSMMTTFNQFVTFGMLQSPSATTTPVNYGRFDFSNNDPYTGKAMGSGFAGKLGGVYKVNDALSVGLAYHSKTWLGDLTTNSAQVSFNANVDNNLLNGSWKPGVSGSPAATYSAVPIPLSGKIHVVDFQWPQMLGAGASYQVSDKLMVVFDYKWINWADVMKNFKMTFTADSTQAGLAQGFAGTELDATLYQKWKDQHVFMIGAGYKLTPEWVVRAGLNITNNPIPDTYVNALFPAIEKNHLTLGAGYMISKASSVDASYTYAPRVKATSPQVGVIAHSQNNAQVMYSYRF